MFEQMLKEMLIRLIKEDPDVKNAIMPILVEMAGQAYRTSVISTVKHVIENDESVQDVIRKQATTDIWEAIEDDVDRKISDCVDELVVVRP